ncbi:MAG: hypothetical protein JWR72_1771 [Flavisolibacter sp.]|jgi:hypothetical protein|nr:hypothetical protein [Flavisolibacter sp.]
MIESLSKKSRRKELLYKMLHPKKEGKYTKQDFLELVHIEGDKAVRFDAKRKVVKGLVYLSSKPSNQMMARPVLL